jgi:hypothetical protein
MSKLRLRVMQYAWGEWGAMGIGTFWWHIISQTRHSTRNIRPVSLIVVPFLSILQWCQYNLLFRRFDRLSQEVPFSLLMESNTEIVVQIQKTNPESNFECYNFGLMHFCFRDWPLGGDGLGKWCKTITGPPWQTSVNNLSTSRCWISFDSAQILGN